jgi:hypothetical protein
LFIYFQFTQLKIVHPKFWLASNVLANLALTLLVWFSSSLIFLCLASALVMCVFVLEGVCLRREYMRSKIVIDEKEGQGKEKSKENDQSETGTRSD